MFAVPSFALAVLAGVCLGLWIVHARAWDLGGRSAVLGYDAAQYAVAARELAEHGRLATPYALPIELVKHAGPPWPLALVQPGLVLVEAALFRAAAAWPPGTSQWLVLLLPLACYVACAVLLARAVAGTIARHAPEVSTAARTAAAVVVGLAFALDPEAQHFSAGGFTEMPFTLALVLAVAWIARGAPARPFAFGLLLGAGGLFRGNILWLAPFLAACFALALPGRRAAGFARALAGCAVVLAPWWFYKWVSFGTPAWDLSALSLWDGVGGRTWYSLNHLPALPDVPGGIAAVAAVAAKAGGHLPDLVLRLAVGPRTLWIVALALAAFQVGRPRATADEAARAARPLAAAATAALAMAVLGVLAAAATVPLARYLAPARLVAEAAGLVAVWAMLWNLPREWAGPAARRWLCVAMAVLAVGWGLLQTGRGLREAGTVATNRGIPAEATMLELARWLDTRMAPGETVMSNLGPSLVWYARRPVLHLALTPADLDACRRRTPFDHVLVVFRSPQHAWPGWDALLERPGEAPHNGEWNVAGVETLGTRDGFTAVWLDLGPLHPPLASNPPRGAD
jgi:hypothetical protein